MTQEDDDFRDLQEAFEWSGLKTIGKSDGSFLVQCPHPDHADNNPSAHVRMSEATGKPLITCHSRCRSRQERTEVVDAMFKILRDYRASDVFANKTKTQRSDRMKVAKVQSSGAASVKAKRAASAQRFEKFEDAVANWKPDKVYRYHDAGGNEVGVVFRRNATKASGKRFVQLHRDDATREYVFQSPKTWKPYNLPGAIKVNEASPGGWIYWVEGEKCVDMLRGAGLAAMTSAGGSNGVDKTDFSDVRGMNIVLLADNDTPGRKYIDAIAQKLREQDNVLWELKLHGLADKQGVDDWLEKQYARGVGKVRAGELLDKLVSKVAEPYRRPVEQIEWGEDDDCGTSTFSMVRTDEAMPGDVVNEHALPMVGRIDDNAQTATDVPTVKSDDAQTANIVPMDNSDDAIDECDLEEYPTDCLGESLASWVRGCGQSIAVPDAALGTAVLPVLVGLIGRTRRIRIRDKFEAPATMMCILVSKPGRGKSRTMDQVKDRMLVIDQEVAASGENRQVWMDNTTPEAMLQVISRNPRSLSVVDEFSVFADLLTRYSQGGGVGFSHITSLWDGKSVRLNRKGVDGKGETVDIPNASLSLLSNTTQPEVLFRHGVVITGFTSRTLIAEPNWRTSPWSWDVPNGEKLDNQLLGIMRSLWNLSPMDKYDNPLTQVLGISAGAMEPWQDYYNDLNQCKDAADAIGNDAYSSCLARVDGQAARLALVLHEVAVATGRHDGPRNEVSRLTMERAWDLAGWYAQEAYRLSQKYGEQQGGKGKDDKGKGDKTPLLESTKPLLWILGKLQGCGRLRVSDVQKGVSAHRHKIDATMMQHHVEQWVSHGILQWLDADKVWFGLANKKSPTK